MRLRLHKEDLLIIGHYLGSVLCMLALVMLVPLVVAFIQGEEKQMADFALSAGITLVFGMALRLLKVHPGRISSKQAFIIMGLGWMVVAFLGAIPLYFSGHYASYLDALFEAVSGFTTTGLTLVTDLDHMAASVNMWRFLMELAGGQSILIVVLSIGLYAEQRGSVMSATNYTAGGRNEQMLPSIQQTARFIWFISALVILAGTIIMAIAALISGLEPGKAFLHAFWIAISAFDTGGFMPQSMGLMHYHSVFLEITVLITGFLGTINFLIYAELGKGNVKELFKNIETKTFALWIFAIVIIGIGALAASDYLFSFESLIRRGLFMILTAATNMGMSVMYPAQMNMVMASGAVFAIVLAMIVGGGMGSTSGGIKAMRIGIILKSLIESIKTALLPDSAVSNMTYHHVSRRLLRPELTSSVLTVTLLYLFTYALGTVVGIVMGYDTIPAIFESVSATSNTGLSAGVITVLTPAPLKILYIFQMWAGRLEFVTLFAVLLALIYSIIPARKRRTR